MRHRGAEQGMVLVWTAGLLIAMIGLLTLAVDIGQAVTARNQLQNQLDSSALAGAMELPNPDVARAKAIEVGNQNRVASDEPSLGAGQIRLGEWTQAATLDPASLMPNAVQVQQTYRQPTLFAGVLGTAAIPLTKQATALKASPVTHFIMDIRADAGEMVASSCVGYKGIRWVEVPWNCPGGNHPPTRWERMEVCVSYQCVDDCVKSGSNFDTCVEGCPVDSASATIVRCGQCTSMEQIRAATKSAFNAFELVRLPNKWAGFMPFAAYDVTGAALPLTQNLPEVRRWVQGTQAMETDNPSSAELAPVIMALIRLYQDQGDGRNSLLVYNVTMGGPADFARAKQEAERARDLGIQLSILAVGPNDLTDPRAGRINPAQLKEIAEITGGTFVHEPNEQRAVQRAQEVMRGMIEGLSVSLAR